MLKKTLQILQLRANMLFMNATKWEKSKENDKKHSKDKEESTSIYSLDFFHESWIESGIAKLTGSHSLPVLIRARGH